MATHQCPAGFEAFAAETVPQGPVGSPGSDGELRLTFAPADGATSRRTRLVSDYARAPFHVGGTLGTDPHEDCATVVVQSATGSVAQGDRLAERITAREGSVCRVTTGAATKVRSMEHNYAAHDTTLTVGPDAHLEYVPRRTILHADARFARHVALDVAPGGSTIVGDVVVPGRLARGESFDFERYRSRFRMTRDGHLLAEDAVDLAPDGRDESDTGSESEATASESDAADDPITDAVATASGPQSAAVLGEYTVLGSLFVVAPENAAEPLADAIHDRITGTKNGTKEGTKEGTNDGATPDSAANAADEDGSDDGTVRAGASTLPNGAGVAVRVLGHRTTAVNRRIHAAYDCARRELIDKPAPEATW